MWPTLWVVIAVAAFFAITAGIIAMAPYAAFAIVIGIALYCIKDNTE